MLSVRKDFVVRKELHAKISNSAFVIAVETYKKLKISLFFKTFRYFIKGKPRTINHEKYYLQPATTGAVGLPCEITAVAAKCCFTLYHNTTTEQYKKLIYFYNR